jgi:hypothetical protein
MSVSLIAPYSKDGIWWTGAVDDVRCFGKNEIGAKLYYQELQMNNNDPIEIELQALIANFMTRVQDVVDETAKPLRLWNANGFDATIATSASGEVVGASTWTKERWLEIDELNLAFYVWTNTPLANCGLSPIQIISKR